MSEKIALIPQTRTGRRSRTAARSYCVGARKNVGTIDQRKSSLMAVAPRGLHLRSIKSRVGLAAQTFRRDQVHRLSNALENDPFGWNDSRHVNELSSRRRLQRARMLVAQSAGFASRKVAWSDLQLVDIVLVVPIGCVCTGKCGRRRSTAKPPARWESGLNPGGRVQFTAGRRETRPHAESLTAVLF